MKARLRGLHVGLREIGRRAEDREHFRSGQPVMQRRDHEIEWREVDFRILRLNHQRLAAGPFLHQAREGDRAPARADPHIRPGRRQQGALLCGERHHRRRPAIGRQQDLRPARLQPHGIRAVGGRANVAELRRALRFGQRPGEGARLVLDSGAAVGDHPDRWAGCCCGRFRRRSLFECRHVHVPPRAAARIAGVLSDRSGCNSDCDDRSGAPPISTRSKRSRTTWRRRAQTPRPSRLLPCRSSRARSAR